MPRGNGGVIGPANIPTTSVAKGVWSLMEQQLAQRQGIWPIGPTVTSDPYFEYTTLLLPGTGTNGAQNNTFLDSSSNTFTVTRNGNTTQGTFSPFSQTGWGNYFDGSGDYLTVPDNAALELGTSNFTIELWVYPTVFTANYLIGKMINSLTASGFLIRLADTTGVALFYASSNGSSWDIAGGIGSVAVTLNAWNHIAVSRSGSSFRLWVNGSSGGTATSASAIQNNTAVVGIGDVAGGGGPTTGYISNVRIVNGSAVYDPSSSTITVPTAPLTAITNTSLLTCQSNRFIDNSTNNFTITRNGDTRVVAFSPFNPSAAYSAATNGGSGYFDGSGDYLNLGGQSAFAFGTGDFTLEGWFYFNALGNSIYDARPSGTFGGNYLTVGVLSSGQVEILINTVQISAGAVTINQWTHIAITRSGTDLRLFVNGAQAGSTVTNSTNLINAASRPTIGVNGANTGVAYVNGYIGGYRVVTGTAVYTSNFTPPTAPLTNITNTSLLLNFTNAGVYDATSKNDLETVGNAQISSTTAKWGSTSIYLDGTGDYLFSKYSTLYDLGGGDFTIEAWIYFSSLPSNNYVVLMSYGNSTGAQRFLFYYDTRTSQSSPGLRFSVVNASNTLLIDVNGGGTSGWSANTWYHVCITRSGNSFKLFRDGVQNGSTVTDADSIIDVTANGLYVGVEPNGSSGIFNGYVQDLRITKGYARYTANFTAPTAAFPLL